MFLSLQGQGHVSFKERQQRMAAMHPLTVSTLTAQQLRLVEYHSTRLIAELLAREPFMSQVSRLPHRLPHC